MASHWKKIYHGAYKINKSGTIMRIKPGNATRIGFVLSPYRPPKALNLYVNLSWNGDNEQFTIDELLRRAFR